MVLELSEGELRERLRRGEITAAVYGLGNVGLPLVVAWLEAGARVIGVDIEVDKVATLNRGKAPTVEPGVAEAIKRFRANGRFEATVDGVDASRRASVKLIAVPTLLREDRRFDGTAVEEALRTVGRGLKRGDLVSMECSVPPGFTEKTGRIILEGESRLKAEDDFGLCASPERIYVGRALEDISSRYPKVVGGVGERSTRALAALYESIAERGVVRMSSAAAAEASKLFEGIYRDVNIALANELAILCREMGLDYMEVREAANSQPFCHLHVPGCGVGGVCIPYYPYFMAEAAAEVGVELPLTLQARRINEEMPEYTVKIAVKAAEEEGIEMKDSKVVIMGLAYRGGASDARGSPTYEIAQLIQRLSASVKVHDPLIREDETLRRLAIPLMGSVEEAIEGVSVVVFATDHGEYSRLDMGAFSQGLKKPAVIVDCRSIFKLPVIPPSVRYVRIGRGVKEQTC